MSDRAVPRARTDLLAVCLYYNATGAIRTAPPSLFPGLAICDRLKRRRWFPRPGRSPRPRKPSSSLERQPGRGPVEILALAANQFARDDHALDVAGPFVNLQ